MNPNPLVREDILERCVHDCMKELYQRAQPSADWDEIVEKYKSGEYDKDVRIYTRHYVSYEEYIYVVNKYCDAYGVKERWRDNVDTVIDYLSKGGNADKYIEAWVDEDGMKHPGYRSYEEIPPIKELFEKALYESFSDCDEKFNQALADKLASICIDTIKKCQDYYKFDREESQVRGTLALGASPSSSKEQVEAYWESVGKPIKIEWRNPLTFWERDNYGSEFESIMIDEYGENWEEVLKKEWEEKEARIKKQREEKLRELAEAAYDSDTLD